MPEETAAAKADLYLIDTMGYIFRAYHAMPRLSNSRGEPTQAVLGFANMLRKLLASAQPAAIAAAFDRPEPTFRDRIYPEYKATRQAMPEDLGPQLPYIRRVLEAFRVAILEFAGYEADDVIGTLARQAAEEGRRVVVVSSDKDMLQLVGERIAVLNPSRGDQISDIAAVEASLGVRPGQVADYMALRGDAVDNIPGAPGIGEKGARDLIQRFGTIAEVLAHAAEVERKTYRESLLANGEQILLSHKLATIHADVPLRLDWEQLAYRPPDLEACKALFTELEFTNLLKAMLASESIVALAPAQAPAPMLATAQPDLPLPAAVATAATPQAVAALLAAPGAVALTIDGEGFGLADGTRALRVGAEQFPLLATALADRRRCWRVHDLKTLGEVLAAAGLPLPEPHAARCEDVQLYSYLLDPTQASHGLEHLAQRHLGLGPLADLAARAAATFQLAEMLRPRLAAAGLTRCYEELDLPLVPVLASMETAGVWLQPLALAELSRELERMAAEVEARIFTLAGFQFNVNSPKQLGEALFEKLGLPRPARRGKTQLPSTAVDILEDLARQFEIARAVLDYRQLAKLRSTYSEALPRLIDPRDGRLHTTFSQVGTATGRLSSANPNLQNIPIRTELGRRIRAAFQAPPGRCLLAADYSQIELRLLAHYSQDPHLLTAFQRGDDIHTLTAQEVFGLSATEVSGEHRRRAKAVNFGIVYGLSPFGLARQLGIPQSEAAEFIRRYFERYAGVRAFIDRTLRQAREEGHVATLFGRRRPLPDIGSRNATLRGFAERTAVNTPLQGTAADLIKLAMVRIHRELAATRPGGAAPQLLLQVHDELVFEVDDAEAAALGARVRHEMEHVYPLAAPLTVEIGAGPNWRDLKPLG